MVYYFVHDAVRVFPFYFFQDYVRVDDRSDPVALVVFMVYMHILILPFIMLLFSSFLSLVVCVVLYLLDEQNVICDISKLPHHAAKVLLIGHLVLPALLIQFKFKELLVVEPSAQDLLPFDHTRGGSC